jgi:hypothetical protein
MKGRLLFIMSSTNHVVLLFCLLFHHPCHVHIRYHKQCHHWHLTYRTTALTFSLGIKSSKLLNKTLNFFCELQTEILCSLLKIYKSYVLNAFTATSVTANNSLIMELELFNKVSTKVPFPCKLNISFSNLQRH